MQKNILVVEDDRHMRDFIGLQLFNAGYAVRGVENGLQAAASCLSTTPDLIISDVHMPQMSGFDMIRILKSEPAMKNIPVIFLTVDESGRELGAQLGAVEYLTKPIEAGALLKAVARALPKS